MYVLPLSPRYEPSPGRTRAFAAHASWRLWLFFGLLSFPVPFKVFVFPVFSPIHSRR